MPTWQKSRPSSPLDRLFRKDSSSGTGCERACRLRTRVTIAPLRYSARPETKACRRDDSGRAHWLRGPTRLAKRAHHPTLKTAFGNRHQLRIAKASPPKPRLYAKWLGGVWSWDWRLGAREIAYRTKTTAIYSRACHRDRHRHSGWHLS